MFNVPVVGECPERLSAILGTVIGHDLFWTLSRLEHYLVWNIFSSGYDLVWNIFLSGHYLVWNIFSSGYYLVWNIVQYAFIMPVIVLLMLTVVNTCSNIEDKSSLCLQKNVY